MKLILLLLSSFSFFTPIHAGIQCLDNNNKPVDWFVFYKLPHLWDHPDNIPISNGTGFLYFDVNDQTWQLMKDGMDDPNNAIYYTLQQYYTSDNSTTFSYMYNDEWPDSKNWSGTSGHTKGLTVFDQYSGFWLIHSIPKFPSTVEWRFPSNAHYYGQMGICISFPYVALSDIALQLFYFNTYTYHFNLPASFGQSVPLLNRLKNGEYQQSPPLSNSKILKSLGGQNFKHFAKTGSWGQDLYANFVVPELRTSMKVETWNHESNDDKNLPSQCSPNPNQSCLSGSFISLPYNISFKSYEDHSKFAVAYTENPNKPPVPYVCIGDINRQTHQMHRGGGTMCIYGQSVYYLYSIIIADTVPCPTGPPPPPPAKNFRFFNKYE